MEREQRVEDFLELAIRVRRECVHRHNRPDPGGSFGNQKPLVALVEALSLEGPPAPESDLLYLLSSYAFWGGEWPGLMLEQEPFTWGLKGDLKEAYQALRFGSFGAWRCQSVEVEGSAQWCALGPPRAMPQSVAAVTDAAGEVIEATPGDVRVGWFVEVGEASLVCFSAPMEDRAAETVERAEEQHVWVDEEGRSASFQGPYYEKDCLRLMAAPDLAVDKLGLDRLYFLPRDQRATFPPRFRRQLSRDLMESVGGEHKHWMVALAEGDKPWEEGRASAWLQQQRRKSARRLFFYRRSTFDFSKLSLLVSDEECLAMLGLDAKGQIDTRRLPPLKGQPSRLLEVQAVEEIPPGLSIGELETWVGERGRRGLSDAFEEALEEHRQRLRWIALVHRLQEGTPSPMVQLPPDYRSLRAIQERFFRGLRHRLVASLLEGTRQKTRLVEALENALGVDERPLIVDDLPMERWELKRIRGVGPKSVEVLVGGLWEAMLNWEEMGRAYGDQGLAKEQVDEARKQIDEGLEMMEDLFS